MTFNLIFLLGGGNLLDYVIWKVFDQHEWESLWFFGPLLSTFVVIAIIANYFSFIKIRFFISKLKNGKPSWFMIVIGISDIMLSLIIAIIVSTAISFFILLNLEGLSVAWWFDVALWGGVIGITAAVWKFTKAPVIITAMGLIILSTLVVIGLKSIVGDGARTLLLLLVAPVAMNPGPLIFTVVTGLGIGILTLLIAVLESVRWCIWAVESKRIWAILDFDRKSAQASAVVVIVLFSVVYWPVVILRNII